MCIHPVHAQVIVVGGVNTPRWFAVDMTSRDIIETHSDAMERIECVQFSPGLSFTFLLLSDTESFKRHLKTVLFQRCYGSVV